MEHHAPLYPPSSFDGDEDMLLLVSQLKPHLPLRRLAESLLNQTHQPLDAIQPLFTTLSNPEGHSWKERLVAAWALGQAPLSPQERDAAAGMLIEVLGNSPREGVWRWIGRGIGASYALMLPFGFLASLGERWHPWLDTFLYMWFVAGWWASWFGVPLSVFYGRRRRIAQTNRLRAAAARALGRLHVPESVGELAGALFDRSPRVREAAATALHEVLPTLTYTHYGLFGAESMDSLGRALNHSDSLLVFKVLEALEKVGTSRAIPFVERVAAQGRMVRLRDAALLVLSTLQERQQQEQDSKTLMRPSSFASAPPGPLLRPAQGGSESEPQQLLRASDWE